MTEPDYKAFFSVLPPEEYLAEGFARNTVAEIDFTMDVCELKPSMRVLDMGCGPGRHSLELARRGISVTGVDFTASFIEFAKQQAVSENLTGLAEFVLADARDFVRPTHFDAAICLCEGGFALLQTDEDNVRVLRHIAASLKTNAPFLLTTMNGYRTIRRAGNPGEIGSTGETRLDGRTMVEYWQPKNSEGREFGGRHYIVPELIRMHHEAGLSVDNVWGGTAGNWGRRDFDWDEIEVMLLSRKSTATMTVEESNDL